MRQAVGISKLSQTHSRAQGGFCLQLRQCQLKMMFPDTESLDPKGSHHGLLDNLSSIRRIVQTAQDGNHYP